MEIKMIDVNDLIEYEKNPRVISNDAVDKVAASIKEFGFKVPIVIDKDNVIIAGHTRRKAALSLGLDKVPTLVADDLNEEQIKAFRLADNKVSEFSDWDMDMLEQEINDLMGDGFDPEQFGFEITQKIEGKKDNKKEKPEIEFSEVLGEESNYIVLKFDNSVDWLQLQSVFDLKTVKTLDSTDTRERSGVGRVVDGIKFIDEMRSGKHDFF